MILTRIKKKLGGFFLDIDSLVIKQPGVYGLIGPNGCGKSTLAKIIVGLVNQDSGEIETEGLSQKDITFLSRKPYMMDDTVYNNLVYPLLLRNIKPDKKLVDEYLNKMNFCGREKQMAKSLSGGEQQKLAFLRAVIFKPKLIIADEAMTAMDLDSLDLFEKTVLEEQKKEKSIWIIISHQMPHLRRICDFFYFMFDGKIETQGNGKEIFSDVTNQRLKKYLRSYTGEKNEAAQS